MEPDVVDLDARGGAGTAPVAGGTDGDGDGDGARDGAGGGAAAGGAAVRRPRLHGPLGAALLAVLAAVASAALATASARTRAAADVAEEQRALARVVVGDARVVDARPARDGAGPTAVIDVTLVNAGPLAVTLLDLDLPSAGDGLASDISSSRGRVLGPAGATRVQLFGTVACPGGGELSYGRGATAGELLVRVRAPDGTVTERPVRAGAEELWADGLRPACAQDGG